MNATLQCRLEADDLEVVLSLTRGRTLAAAAERLGVDTSTVFRSVQRIERQLGHTLFERSRQGYLPSELASRLAEHAELVESALEAARSEVQMAPEEVTGSVRITSTDTILHGLVAPALKSLRPQHPNLSYELHAGNEAVNLARRDADIAVRATRRPPQHLVGKYLGPIRVALYAGKGSGIRNIDTLGRKAVEWIAPDDALPDHSTVTWRRKHFPKALPTYRVGSIMTVMELVALNLGVGLFPMFLAAARKDMVALTGALEECQSDLWLLTHKESRHLRRVSTVFGHLASTIELG